MLNRIDHIGIAVEDLEQSLSLFRDVLGMTYLGAEQVPSQKVKVATLRVGAIRIELLQPTSEDSPIAKFLKKRGRGVHHIAFQVDDLPAALKRCEAQGLKLVDKSVRPGAAGASIAFLDPKCTQGVLTELTTGSDH